MKTEAKIWLYTFRWQQRVGQLRCGHVQCSDSRRGRQQLCCVHVQCSDSRKGGDSYVVYMFSQQKWPKLQWVYMFKLQTERWEAWAQEREKGERERERREREIKRERREGERESYTESERERESARERARERSHREWERDGEREKSQWETRETKWEREREWESDKQDIFYQLFKELKTKILWEHVPVPKSVVMLRP